MEGATMPAPPAAAHHDSRPAIGFPLGTALLVVVIFCLSGVFACCYHWEKLRSLRGGASRRRRRQQQEPSLDALEEGRPQPSSPPSPTSKLVPEPQENKEEKIQSLPVIMPGDKIPKFMAWPCPRQHSPPVADASAVATTTPEVAIPSQSLAAECSVN
ncbi:uncharacterized protein At5g65660-like [Curcuma longa]|uniref:uncharacterized protein At5g65660-like n=1 Tax=Curcuma longa TaxID=136217 RepID=UPI003D9F2185